MSLPWPSLVIILAAITGSLIASYIRYKKTAHQVLVCPLHSNCETVTHSQFSRFLGIPVELMGIAYYVIIAVSYLVFQFMPDLAGAYSIFALLVLSTTAFLFSAYLTFIQAFTLKQWCTWCLFSAGLCTAIFIAALIGTNISFAEMLQANHRGIVGVHLFGLALGLGAATLADIFFFKFIKDFRISHEEAAILNTLSQIIWLGLALLMLSGIGLYLANAEALNHSSKFLVKLVVVGVILVNGMFLNLMIAPRLVQISFGGPHAHVPGELTRLRRIAFALGAISMTSWYSAFTLGMIKQVPLPFSMLLGIYLLILCGAIIGSQITERLMMARRQT